MTALTNFAPVALQQISVPVRWARVKFAPVKSLLPVPNETFFIVAPVKLVRTNLERANKLLVILAPVRFLPLQFTVPPVRLQTTWGFGVQALPAAVPPARAVALISAAAASSRARARVVVRAGSMVPPSSGFGRRAPL